MKTVIGGREIWSNDTAFIAAMLTAVITFYEIRAARNFNKSEGGRGLDRQEPIQ